MKTAKTLVLISLLLLAAAPLQTSFAAGGEDFPFSCHIAGSNSREAFRVEASTRSSTGYILSYFERGRFIKQMPVWLDTTLDNKHVRLRARYQSGLLTDKHLLAFIGKTDQDFSSADTSTTLRGRAPSSYEFRPLHCQ
jgi:hypothetical protein